ncbi:hypothetical protein T472_0204130 [Youngiibacter fragilis 232.1]|uniref:DUF7309 domain-containing protein n=1 Tax=Youngiibacter fragilis 232.1 TaxID=994573 RepID=V7IAE9_9CLOT|nr:hypothetical protein T472_0204130 [Youngiibacter fragilis 232.1]
MTKSMNWTMKTSRGTRQQCTTTVSMSFLETETCFLPADREKIDLLGLKYRGRKAWPLFRSLEKGRMQRMIDAKEAARLTDVILQLAEAFSDIRARELVLSDDNDETILRRYDRKSKKWETVVASLNYKPKSLASFSITDESS